MLNYYARMTVSFLVWVCVAQCTVWGSGAVDNMETKEKDFLIASLNQTKIDRHLEWIHIGTNDTTTNNNTSPPEIPIDEIMDECPTQYFLNPKDTDRLTFLRQFKPCGFYSKCQHKFATWFGISQLPVYEPIEANKCYPIIGQYNLEKEHGIHIVQFDTGLDPVTFEAYATEGDLDLIKDTNLTSNAGIWLDPFAQDFTTHVMPLKETCVESLVRYPDDWGNIPNTINTYNCMGECGSSCLSAWAGRDCLKHDVCSYFKGLAMEDPAVGFCRDFDCGDETAQSVVNCWSSDEASRTEETAVVCSQESDMVMNPAARLRGQKRACSLRTKWERSQGIPWAKRAAGEPCSSPDDCISGACSRWNIFNRVCLP